MHAERTYRSLLKALGEIPEWTYEKMFAELSIIEANLNQTAPKVETVPITNDPVKMLQWIGVIVTASQDWFEVVSIHQIVRRSDFHWIEIWQRMFRDFRVPTGLYCTD